MRRKVAAILIAAMVILGGPLVPAHAASAPDMELVSAEVLARGAAARLTFDVRCDRSVWQAPPGPGEIGIASHERDPYAELLMILDQTGTGEREGRAVVTCGGSLERVAAVVLPGPGASAFKQGKASVHAELRFCNFWGTCDSIAQFDFQSRMRKGGAVPPPVNSPIQVVSAGLVSNGTAVRVVVKASNGLCDFENYSFSVEASISQRVGKTTTQSSANVSCPTPDGGGSRYSLVLPVQLGQRNFRAGRAFIQATITYCILGFGCYPTSVESIAKLTNDQPT